MAVNRRAALIVALGTSWIASGGSFLGMRVVTQSLPPITVTAIRMLGACLILAAPLLWRLRDPANRPTVGEIGNAIVAGVLLLVLGQMMLVIGVSTTPAGTAAVFGSASPLILAILAWWWAGEPLGGRRLVGLALGFAGLVLMGWSAVSEGNLSLPGTAAILFSAAAWAVGSFWGERRRLPRDAVVSITIQTIVAALVIAALVPLSGEWERADLVAVPPTAWRVMAFVIATGLLLFGSFSWLNAHVGHAGEHLHLRRPRPDADPGRSAAGGAADGREGCCGGDRVGRRRPDRQRRAKGEARELNRVGASSREARGCRLHVQDAVGVEVGQLLEGVDVGARIR